MKRFAQKLRFFAGVGALYALTLVFAFNAFGGLQLLKDQPVLASTSIQNTPPPVPYVPDIKVTAAKPSRLVIPSLSLDLPIDDGAYDAATGKWTLSDNHAHYALPSTVPNDYTGNTLIYGHKYDWIFGILPNLKPGATMDLYLANGKIFTYEYKVSRQLTPKDDTVFRYDGKASVSLQTCSGRFNEFRTIFDFDYKSVR